MLQENNPGCRESRGWGQVLSVNVCFEMVPSQLENLSYYLKTTGEEQTKHKAARRKGIMIKEMNEKEDGQTKPIKLK